jgi:hypothetical protein
MSNRKVMDTWPTWVEHRSNGVKCFMQLSLNCVWFRQRFYFCRYFWFKHLSFLSRRETNKVAAAGWTIMLARPSRLYSWIMGQWSVPPIRPMLSLSVSCSTIIVLARYRNSDVKLKEMPRFLSGIGPYPLNVNSIFSATNCWIICGISRVDRE